MTYDIAIIGAGAVGAATAYKLLQTEPTLKVIVLDKEQQVAAHQTGHNSGVIHSGIYYQPGSKKALTCKSGREQLVAFSKAYDVPHEVCGKIIVATREDELETLQRIYERGIENGLPDSKLVTGEDIPQYEPHCRGLRAIHVPYTGIINYTVLVARLLERVRTMGGEVRYGFGVQELIYNHANYLLTADGQTVRTRRIIACAGLQADRIARLDDLRPKMRIVPFRGDYYELTPAARQKVRNLIYPVPRPELPFLGVHFTRMVSGEVECGPNAVFSFAREGYSKTSFNTRDAADALSYGGTWRLFASHFSHGLKEYQRAFSKAAFLKQLRGLIPDLQAGDIQPGRCGIRAQALGPDGKLLDDFYLAQTERSVHVLNAPSPAATACLAIADEIVRRSNTHFALNINA
ncbi:MAG: L-2-hydroxyglutarate oxidase [Bacteroidota bacterium]